MNKILTIVVPTYNAEKYLRDNLNSFCTPEILSDIEILIINDGSTDHSLEIAQEYVDKYPDAYRVISKENGGHGSGINYGIRYATGKYFKVVDADDWVAEDAFIKLVNTLKTQDADIVYSGFLWTYDNGNGNISEFKTKAEIPTPFKGVQYQKIYDFDAIADNLYVKMHSMTIKTEILQANNIFIDENCFYVDTEYVTYPIPYVKTICFVDAFVYHYRLGRQGQSISIDKMQRNIENYDRVLDSLLTFYKKLGVSIACTPQKKHYIASFIARVVAGKIKILLSFPICPQSKLNLVSFEHTLKKQCPDVYFCNINLAVTFLRKTKYLLYHPISLIIHKLYT